MSINDSNSNQLASLCIAHINIYHLFNKLHDVSVLLNGNSPIDILGISETRQLPHCPSLPNYTFFNRDSNYIGHTGMGIFIRNNIIGHIKRRHDLESPEVESMWLELKQKSRATLIGFVYRNPASTYNWYDDFISMMDKINKKDPNVLILGDFNIDLLMPQISWECTTSLFGLHQLIDEPTRITSSSATLIDHIYTNNLNMISDVHTSDIHISDHKPIFCKWSFKMPTKSSKGHTTIQFRSMKHFNKDFFLNDLSNISFSNVLRIYSADEALTLWYDKFCPVLNKHAPLRQKRVKHPTLPRWLTQDIMHAMKIRNNLKKQNKFNEYKKQRNKVKSMVRAAKKVYFNTLVNENSDTTSLWKAMNELTYKSRRNTAVSHCKFSSDDFNHHFTHIVDSIVTSNCDRFHHTQNENIKLEQFCKEKLLENASASIPCLTSDEVFQLISDLPNKKSMGLDNINSYFLKISLPYILESLTHIYNLCLKQNIFPSILKNAKVIPLPKSKDLGDLNNFRPISLLSVISKPLEKHIYNSLICFVEDHDLFHPFQSGFRKHHSCHTALTRMCDSWLSAINRNQPEITGCVFLDLKKAFDLVDHDILLKKLSIYFQNSNTLALIKSYITNRSQQVFLNGTFSTVSSIKCGVPQGSVLGPLLFGLFINDLPLNITNPKIICDLFADDNSMHSSASNIETVKTNLQNGLDEVSNWCVNNHMALNPKKTKCMAIATRQKHQIKPLTLDLTLHANLIDQVDEHKVLGVILDKTFSWKPQIDSICKRLSKNLFLLSQLKYYLDSRAMKLFFYAHCMSHINYASTLWSGASNNNLLKLNSLHRRAIKLISDKPLLSTDEKFINLEIMPLAKQFDFNIAVLMFKVRNGLAPHYLTTLLYESNRRSESTRYICPITRVDIFKTSFAFAGPKVWNSLPIHVKSMNSLYSFKNSLKSHMLYS